MLTKKDLEHLAELARIELGEGEEQKLQKDLVAILDYFKELQSVDTENVLPMTAPRSSMTTGVPAKGLGSGTEFPPKADQSLTEKNVLREDELASSIKRQASGIEDDTGKGAEQFPETKNGYLKVPPVF